MKAFYLTGRRFLGIRYYRLKRRIQLRLGRISFSRSKSATPLPYQAATHHSLLLRQLKNVDMWMQHNKVKNLSIALPRLNGIIVRPGETFSYWDLIGKPNRRKGYLAGMHLVRGTVRSGVGGGLCQLSNLIYWMTLHTSLTVTERHRHSYDVFPDSNRTLPFGCGATCYYNYIDLQIKNETEHTFQLQLRLTDTHLVGEWRQS
ncbi:MAG: VanW family protein, partial [Gorillibacterium sp.]|nr:VanW family protein [Gorillibacterium sp.]